MCFLIKLFHKLFIKPPQMLILQEKIFLHMQTIIMKFFNTFYFQRRLMFLLELYLFTVFWLDIFITWLINNFRLQAKNKMKDRLNQNTNKYFSSTMSKNFFNNDEDDYQQQNKQKVKISVHQNTIQETSQAGKRATYYKRSSTIKLQPIKQGQTVQIYRNVEKNNILQNQKQFPHEKQELKDTKSNKKRSDMKKRLQKARSGKKQQLFQLHSNHKLQQQGQNQQPINIPVGNKKLNTINLFFEQSQQEKDSKKQQTNLEQNGETSNIEIFGNRSKKNHKQMFVDSQEEQKKSKDLQVVKKIKTAKHIQNQDGIITGSQYFNFENKITFHRQMFLNVRQKTILPMEIIRDKGGFNSFWPQFHLHFSKDSQYVMSAKKTSSKPSSTFVISSSRENFELNGQQYLGKMKSNIMGDILNIFGPGLNPSQSKQLNVAPRQLLASIVYETSLFQMGKPRQFSVFVMKTGYHYYKDLIGPRMYQQQIALSQLYKIPSNTQKIIVLHNKKPVWIEQSKHFFLNFKGRVQKPSVKNFILQQQQTKKELMLFGRVNQNKFNVDVYSNISPFLAFAIALSSFDSRLMCQ